jgi:hypothetical protein
MDGRCVTCKWWAPNDGYQGDLPEGWRICVLVTGDFDPDEPQVQAAVLNQFASDGQLATASDFGCVLHALRDDAP